MEDTKQLKDYYFKIPPITRYYLTILFITAAIATYIPFLTFIIRYIILNYELVFKYCQFWRLFTNILFISPFSPQLISFFIMVYISCKSLEQNSIRHRRYAQFIMMIIYMLIILNIVDLIAYLVFKIAVSFTLCHQLILSFVYVDSKREPQKNVLFMYIFKIKNCYYPYALIVLNIVSGGSIYDNIIGIIVGNIYFVLKDVLPLNKNIDLLKTPKFLVDYLEKNFYGYIRLDDDDNGENGNQPRYEFVNRGGNANNPNNNQRRGFTPFGGRGYVVG